MATCEFGEFSATVKRCRKRARVVVGFRVPFGMQLGPKGETQLYRTETTKRCIDHSKVSISGPVAGTMMIQEYELRLAAQPS